MIKFCSKCGAELDENGLCPNCAGKTAEAEPEKTAPETIENVQPETAETPAAETETADVIETAEEEPETTSDEPEAIAVEAEPQAAQPAADEAAAPAAEQTLEILQQPKQQVQPSKFYYAFRQVGNILKHFFSKNTTEAISAQYSEVLPIWVILLPVCALISALSMTLSFDASRGLSIGAGSIFGGMELSGLEVFLISFAMSAAVELAYCISVMVYLRAFKIKAKFKSAANLTTSAYIAVTILDLFNIITVGFFKSESTALSQFGMIAFVLLLYLAVDKVLNGKKPFWSFFLMLAAASAAAMITALVVSCPIIVMRGLEELARSVTVF